MSAPINPTRDLTGKNIRCWFVVAYAGLRDGVHYWRCMCRASLKEKIVAEPDILDRKVNALISIHHRWQELEKNPSGWIYGEWTVLDPAGEFASDLPSGPAGIWRCRCSCGAEREIRQADLTSRQTLSCGCRPDAEVQAELQVKWRHAKRGFSKEMSANSRRHLERRFDSKWTDAMQRALCCSQPSCVLCGTTDDLTNHHLRPLGTGHGLEPGNVVRLCRTCNSAISSREPSQLYPRIAHKLETAATQFKDYWENKCTNSHAPTVVSAEEPPKVPDPDFIALLRAVERADDAAIPALADWLEERGDQRASAIREVARWEAVIRQTRTETNEMIWLEFQLDGKRCGPSGSVLRLAEDTGESLAQRIEEVRKRQQSQAVWQRLGQLGLSISQRNTLKQYLGITPSGAALTSEEIAQRSGIRVQTIRIRIGLGLHLLRVPSA